MAILGQDIVVLLRLCDVREKIPIHILAGQLFLSPSEVQYALKRLHESRLVNQAERRAIRRNVEEFIAHGVKFQFPVRPGEVTRGTPTAMSAPMLMHLMPPSPGVIPEVWPDPDGQVRGQSITPLHKSVPKSAKLDPCLYKLLALTDVFRLGSARASEVAAKELHDRLNPS
jgi:hypothetical protein